jgi:RimJ/RimL family protein N-acetyltransferase
MCWQIDPIYGRYFRDFGRYLSLPELEVLPQQTGVEVMMFHHNDKVVGMNSLKPWNGHVVESGLMIDKGCHNQKLGLQYMKEIEDYCGKIRGFKKIVSFICASDDKLIKNSEKYGFKIEGRLTNFTFYNGKYEDACLIAKEIII